MQGHCASRRATPEECRAACAQVEAVGIQALMLEADPNDETTRILTLGAADELASACKLACTARGTVERTRCLQAVTHIDEVASCP